VRGFVASSGNLPATTDTGPSRTRWSQPLARCQ
jgi:hypothetical protein